MTAVDFLLTWMTHNQYFIGNDLLNAFEQAKEMEKQQIQDFGARCCLMTKQKNQWTLEKLYNDLYESKGSDDTKTDKI